MVHSRCNRFGIEPGLLQVSRPFGGCFSCRVLFLVRAMDLLPVTRGLYGQDSVPGWWRFGILGLREFLHRNSEVPWETRRGSRPDG